jgi:hypothetical protein
MAGKIKSYSFNVSFETKKLLGVPSISRSATNLFNPVLVPFEKSSP